MGCLRAASTGSVGRGSSVQSGLDSSRQEFRRSLHFDKEEGGRHRPFFTNYVAVYSAQRLTGVVPFRDEMVMPGDNVAVTIELITPIAMEEKLRFAIREGGRTVGAGVVTSIIE